jgi:hypothetical protein
MASINPDNLSPFGRLAIELDGSFVEISRLSLQIQRLDIHSDSGLDHALKLLNQFAQHGQSVAEGMKDFSKLLQDAHHKTDMAAQAVAERAQVIYQRKQQQNQLQEKLALVEKDLSSVSQNLAGFRQEGKKEFSEEEKQNLTAALSQLQGQLEHFVTIAQSIKDEATELKFKNMERTAQSLLDSLQASHRKIQQAIASR